SIEAGLLVRRRPKVIVRKDSSQRTVLVAVVHERIKVPALYRRLRAQPAKTYRTVGGCSGVRARLAAQRRGVSHAVKNILGRGMRRLVGRAAGIHSWHAWK